jgi:hypothetical protein
MGAVQKLMLVINLMIKEFVFVLSALKMREKWEYIITNIYFLFVHDSQNAKKRVKKR